MDERQQSHKEQPIIIKKIKKGGGHGHHGGAWKVAYADFVTAMMAFFIVMWILGQSAEVKQKVQEYFTNPTEFNIFTGEPKSGPSPIDLNLGQTKPGNDTKGSMNKSQNSILDFNQGLKDTLVKALMEKAKMDSAAAAKRVEEAGNELRKKFASLLAQRPDLDKILSSIKIEMTNEGLRIELIETSESLFFEVGSAKLSKEAILILQQLAAEIGKLPNYVDIEGHTDSRSYGSGSGYSNWELSSDRANSARRVLEKSGLWEGQILKVTGYADRKLRNPDNPFDVINRRISILIKQISANQFMPKQEAAK